MEGVRHPRYVSESDPFSLAVSTILYVIVLAFEPRGVFEIANIFDYIRANLIVTLFNPVH